MAPTLPIPERVALLEQGQSRVELKIDNLAAAVKANTEASEDREQARKDREQQHRFDLEKAREAEAKALAQWKRDMAFKVVASGIGGLGVLLPLAVAAAEAYLP